VITTASIGRIQASAQDLIMHQRNRVVRPNPVIYLNSAASWPYELGTVSYGVNPHARRLAEHGFVVIAPDLNLTWGNATGRTAIGAALTYASSEFGASAAPILVGASHGATCAIMYGLEGTTTPACVVTFATIADLEAVQVANTGGQAAGITAAWGSNPVPGTADTLARASELSAIPFYMQYASDDDFSVNIATFASSHGDVTLDNVGALGHTDAAMAAADTEAIITFVNAAV
jgi:hypothetical protein